MKKALLWLVSVLSVNAIMWLGFTGILADWYRHYIN